MPAGRGPGASWEQLAAHRDNLLQIARRHAASAEAAEDAVQEALARAAAHWDSLDPARLGAWLNTVTLRICADQHRERSIERRHLPRLLAPSNAIDPGDAVTDRLEDAWLVQTVGELSTRHRQVLTAIAEQGTVPAAAQSLGMTRQATESLLKRARAVMRSRLAKTLTALGILQLRRLRPLSTGGTATGLAALAAVLMMVLPQLAPWVVPGTEAPGRHPLHADGDVATSPAHLWSTGARGHRRQGLPPSARLVGSARAMPIDPPVVVVPPHRINVGPIEQDDGGQGVVIKHASDSALKSVRDCLRDGVVVSKTFIGCKAAQKSSA